jgi:predicted small lipoprotein YifL
MKKIFLQMTAILLILAGFVSCGKKENLMDIPLDYVNCPCDHETEFIEKKHTRIF